MVNYERIPKCGDMHKIIAFLKSFSNFNREIKSWIHTVPIYLRPKVINITFETVVLYATATTRILQHYSQQYQSVLRAMTWQKRFCRPRAMW